MWAPANPEAPVNKMLFRDFTTELYIYFWSQAKNSSHLQLKVTHKEVRGAREYPAIILMAIFSFN